MGYIADVSGKLDGFGCGESCGCGRGRASTRLSEWYITPENGDGGEDGAVSAFDEPPPPPPAGTTPMTPAHAGGAMGELDAAFVLGQRGFGIVIGPGGPGGHRLTATGFDIVAYNPRTGEVWIVDNKASGGGRTVQGATAITVNLQQNLADAIQQIRAARAFPNQAAIIQKLDAALTAVRAGRPLPSGVSRYITNAGGYHSGISRRLRAQGVQFLDLTGVATRRTRAADIQRARQRGVPPRRPRNGSRRPRRGRPGQGKPFPLGRYRRRPRALGGPPQWRDSTSR
jgi:hypothetical protein